MARRTVAVLYHSPQCGEIAVASDGTVFSRWYENKGRYGYGWTRWRRANEQETAAVASSPEWFRYGFHSTFTRSTDGISRLRLPQEAC